MKRPEGFDRPSAGNDDPKAARRWPSPRRRAAPAPTSGPANLDEAPPAPTRRTTPQAATARARTPEAATPQAAAPQAAGASAAGAPQQEEAVPQDRAAHRHARRAARERRRFEKSEVRRFTRRSRRRKAALFAAAGTVVTMGTLVAVGVYSPLLALETIEIDGTSRLDPEALHAAVEGQLDTPLALLDFDRITGELEAFPLIRSYVTETIPPDTLVIHVVEREPVGWLADGSGFDLVDPAGVVIESSTERAAGVPLIDTSGGDSDSAAFDAAVEVLVALPDSVLAQLDIVSARTRDDVRLTLAGGGAAIVWGSADDSEIKARTLAAALAQDYPGVSEYNVSAPGQLTYR